MNFRNRFRILFRTQDFGVILAISMQKQDIRKILEATRYRWAYKNHHMKFLYLYKQYRKGIHVKVMFTDFVKEYMSDTYTVIQNS